MITGAIFTEGAEPPGHWKVRGDLYSHVWAFRKSGGKRLVYDQLPSDVQDKLKSDGIELIQYLDRPEIPPFERRWFAYQQLSHDVDVNWFIDINDVLATRDLEQIRGTNMSLDCLHGGAPNYRDFEWHMLQLRHLPAQWSVILKKYDGWPVNAGCWSADRDVAKAIIAQMCVRLSERRICYPVVADMAAFGVVVLHDLKVPHKSFVPDGDPLIHDRTIILHWLEKNGAGAQESGRLGSA